MSKELRARVEIKTIPHPHPEHAHKYLASRLLKHLLEMEKNNDPFLDQYRSGGGQVELSISN